MPPASRLTDSITGTTAGEHSGHSEYPHSPLPMTGEITGGCSGNVLINGLGAATVGSTTTEYDDCCGTAHGRVSAGSGTVFINRKPAARMGDAIEPHNGTARVASGSANVFIGG